MFLYNNVISKRGIRKYYIKTGPSYEVITDVSLEVLRGQRISLLMLFLINVSFIPFFVFYFWSLLATNLRKYGNIT